KALETHYDLELYPTLLFEYTTIAELAEYLSQARAAHSQPQQPARIEPISAGDETGQSFEKSFYQPVWKTNTLAGKPETDSASPLILLYSPDKKVIRALKKEITTQPGQTSFWIFVSSGKEYQKVGDNHYVLNPESEEAWSRLLTTLTEKKQIPSGVVFLNTQEVEALEAYLQRQLYPLFQLTTGLIRARVSQEIQLLYLYQGGETLTTCFGQAVSGFGKTVAQENSKFRFKTIGLENNSEISLPTLIRQEMAVEVGSDIVIRYRAGERQVQSLAPCTNALKAARVPLLRKQGSYIITGGAGGIGLILVEGLLRNYEANLILVGRSALSEDRAYRLQQLNDLGVGTVTYLPADISSLEETTLVVNQARARFGSIQGIIHAAGVIEDSLIPQKTLPQLRAVVAPKVMGAIHLDYLLATEDLDFFVLFSSVTALWGNIGQADYAYANSFLDGFASYRHTLVEQGRCQGQTLSINWPLWKNGGMQLTPEARQALTHAGLRPVDDRTGWQVFETAVNQQQFQQLLFLWQSQQQETAEVAREVGEEPEIAALAPVLEKNDHPSVSSQTKGAKRGSTQNYDEAIAIIGLSGRYPLAENLAEFWQNLKQGRDCIREIPKERWDYRPYFDADKNKPGKSYSKWGGFMADVDKFDPLFFNISPREAEFIDPQGRLFLQTVWHTLEDAGYTRQTLQQQLQSRVGVFVGVMWGEYQLYGQDQLSLSSSYASIANRVSYYLNLHGPSLAVDTMCSSSLTSIHLACESIKRGECLAAVAGGVNLSIHPNKYLQLSQG
ncbi:MAG: SDR family NAD(P)-dependent oxidoreductase, partial [bacterium]|nr:SDR family NAD(P)-dependent oxidoreductase [bacterium]